MGLERNAGWTNRCERLLAGSKPINAPEQWFVKACWQGFVFDMTATYPAAPLW